MSEPWLLLPLVYATRPTGTWAEYQHNLASRAFGDLVTRLPAGRRDYLQEVARTALSLYRKMGRADDSYFVDKTPRYHLICQELFEMFPDGKFIFLWRNPLSIIASIMETWTDGSWCMPLVEIDLYRGMEALHNAAVDRQGISRQVRYESFVRDPQAHMRDIAQYLGLDPQEFDLAARVELQGQLGDQREPGDPGGGSIHKWKATLNNPYRKRWCRRYLEWLGPERLDRMGFDLEALRSELLECRATTRHMVGDAVRDVGQRMRMRFKQKLLGTQLLRGPRT